MNSGNYGKWHKTQPGALKGSWFINSFPCVVNNAKNVVLMNDIRIIFIHVLPTVCYNECNYNVKHRLVSLSPKGPRPNDRLINKQHGIFQWSCVLDVLFSFTLNLTKLTVMSWRSVLDFYRNCSLLIVCGFFVSGKRFKDCELVICNCNLTYVCRHEYGRRTDFCYGFFCLSKGTTCFVVTHFVYLSMHK